jgi:hypothetical protein
MGDEEMVGQVMEWVKGRGEAGVGGLVQGMGGLMRENMELRGKVVEWMEEGKVEGERREKEMEALRKENAVTREKIVELVEVKERTGREMLELREQVEEMKKQLEILPKILEKLNK